MPIGTNQLPGLRRAATGPGAPPPVKRAAVAPPPPIKPVAAPADAPRSATTGARVAPNPSLQAPGLAPAGVEKPELVVDQSPLAPPPALIDPATDAANFTGAREDMLRGHSRDMPGLERQVGRQGVFDRMHDWVRSDVGRATLMRSAAGTLQGGLGAGMQAGIDYNDKLKASGEDARRYDLESRLRERGIDIQQQGVDQQGKSIDNQFALGSGDLYERSRANRAGERIQIRGQDTNANVAYRGQNVAVRGQDVGAAVTTRGQDIGLQDNREGRIVQQNEGAANRGVTVRGQDMDYDASLRGGPAGIGSKGGTRTIVKKTPGSPGSDGWFSDTPATAETIETIEMPLLPSVAAPNPDAIAALKGNPGLAPQFDAKYGPGSAAQYLGGR